MKASGKIILAFLFFIAIGNSIKAQHLTASEEQGMLLKVIDLLEDYQRYSNMDVDFSNYGNGFRDLFVDDDAPVFNDLYGIDLGDILSAKDYATVMTSKSATSRVVIKNINRGDFYYEDDRWKLDCTFDKYVNIMNECGVEFASDFYNSSDYKLTAKLVYNAGEEQFRIEKITGDAERIRTIPENYRIIRKMRNLDEKVKINGMLLDFNAIGQAVVAPTGKPKYKDPNSTVKLVADNIDCRMYHLKLRLKRWNIKMHYDMSYGEIMEFDSKYKLTEGKANENTYGLDFCYVVPSRSSFKVGFGFGAGMTTTSLGYVYHSQPYSYDTKEDVDNDAYTRYYNNLSVAQNMFMKNISVPLYLDFGIYFNKYVALTLDAGVKLYYNLSNEIQKTDGWSYVYGIYGPEYNYIRLDEHFGYNGFGANTYSNDNLDNKEITGLQKLSMDVFGSAGLRINIPGTPLAIDASASYEYGKLMPMIKNDRTIGNSKPLAYNSISGMSSKEHLRSLTELASSIYRKGIRINVGLMVRL